MIDLDPFDFSDYRKLIRQFLGPKNQRNGRRTKLAHHLGCQQTYLSQILSGKAQMSLEQAYGFTEFLDWSSESTEFFLLLVQRDRAGTSALKKHFEEKIQAILKQRQKVSGRIAKTQSLDPIAQAEYYSSWVYSAIHIGLTIPDLKDPQALADYLGLNLVLVERVIRFLQKSGLIEIANGEFKVTSMKIHLDPDSYNIFPHHMQWRHRALESIIKAPKEGVHFSAVVSISKSDADLIKKSVLSAIKKNVDTIIKSKEEELYAYNLDFFPLVTER